MYIIIVVHSPVCTKCSISIFYKHLIIIILQTEIVAKVLFFCIAISALFSSLFDQSGM